MSYIYMPNINNIENYRIKKDIIIDIFKQLIKQIKMDIDNTSGREQTKNMFRLKSIETATKIIINLKTVDLTINQIKNIKGIGDGSIRRIKEIIETGKLKEIKITKKDEVFLKIIADLEETYGVGKKTAYNLLKNYNIKSVDELKNKIDNKEIEVSDIIKKGLKYVGKINTNIDRKVVDKIHDLLLDTLLLIEPELFGTICGSYRRQKEFVGDIDFIITHPKLNNKRMTETYTIYFKDFLLKLKNMGFLIESLTGEDVKTKFMGIFKYNNIIGRIDIRYIPYESYYYALLYFTGNKDFNRNMRMVAISHGYKLNEYGLYKNNKSFKVNSEKEIFDLLRLEYVQPEKRI